MNTGSFEDRFGSLDRLYGEGSIVSLRAAKVCVIGVGGVGSWAAEALARSGVGSITLIDPDEVCITNINRQLPALDSTWSRPKVEVLKERMLQINPDCDVTTVERYLTIKNIDELIGDRFDYVIDAIDEVWPKTYLVVHCLERCIPLVTAGAAGGVKRPDLIKVADLNMSYNDRLLAQVRRRLRQKFGVKLINNEPLGVLSVFSGEKATVENIEACDLKEFDQLKCDTVFGTTTFITGIFGFMAAGSAINFLVKATKHDSNTNSN